MNPNKKSLPVLFTLILLNGLILVNAASFGAAQEGLIVYLNADTVWAKANSPYTLNGPVVVKTGVTLTITEGVIVNLNNYYIYVNGTLKAMGSASDKISIYGGAINYGNSSQTIVDSTFDYTVVDASITSSKPLTVTHSTINKDVTVGDSSTFSNNNINGFLKVGNSATITNNQINADMNAGDHCAFTYNTLNGDITTGTSATISHNTISGSHLVNTGMFGSYYTTAVTVMNGSDISDNLISGGVSAVSTSISNNVISGGATTTQMGGRWSDSTSAVSVSGTSSITSNAIYSRTGGWGVLVKSGYTTVRGNNIQNSIRVAGDALVDDNLISNGGVQVGDIYIPSYYEIDYGFGDSVIRNNIIKDSTYGISSTEAGGTATIEHNLITNCSFGIDVYSQVTIRKNTINNSTIAIGLKVASTPISNNNIMAYTENSITLTSVSSAIDAANNWWGTTDIQKINLAIHDSKYDVNLGTVNITPVLNVVNPEAPATTYTLQVPVISSTDTPAHTSDATGAPSVTEYPIYVILLAILAVASASLVVALIIRKVVENSFTKSANAEQVH